MRLAAVGSSRSALEGVVRHERCGHRRRTPLRSAAQRQARDELFDTPIPPRGTPGIDTNPAGGHGHVRQRVAAAIKGLLATIRGRC